MEFEIRDLLKEMRLKAKLTQKELAMKMGMDRTTVSKFETGTYTIAAADLFRWVKTTDGQDQLINFMYSTQIITDAITSVPGLVGLLSPVLRLIA
ncbi:helix-turn-helix transcriptional regulator [Gracilibacillus oryzae]|uniref:Helix-turn-helix transcriptional regulator n=1 Tax=Gracilibacillus oryzae TaxID=1672701 RepID=A0A7C8KUP5_9BACI|nr:helix-turn-helix transcriptional regulator [Gracilibacillus oryzae]KAB8139068.1 helix-turn-helix transcriptional regulator [Gracilibacillus oryzae]